MWLGYPGTSGAPFMEYIITDKVTTPLSHAHHFSEKLAYMSDTFFVGDHKQMFPHLIERVLLLDGSSVKKSPNSYGLGNAGDGVVVPPDNVAVVNATDLSPIIEKAEVIKIREVAVVTSVNASANQTTLPVVSTEKVEVVKTVIELPTTQAVQAMISQGQIQTTVNGIVVQNGLATTQMNNKAATG